MSNEFEQPESFYKNGFVIVRSVIDKQEIQDLRRHSLDVLKKLGNPRMLLPRHVISDPIFMRLPFIDKVVSTLKASLGDELCYFLDYQLQHNMFGSPGWHLDSGSEEKKAYLQASNYRFAKVGLYLQDNTYEWGGGISIVPKGHKYPLKTPSKFFNQKLKALFNNLGIKKNSMDVDIKAGDLVFFDSRLPHKSTYPHQVKQPDKAGTYHFLSEISDQNSKIVFYWNACHIDMKNDFLNNSVERSVGENENGEVFFSDYLQYSFPEDILPEIVEAVKNYGIDLACLPGYEAKKYSEKMSQLV